MPTPPLSMPTPHRWVSVITYSVIMLMLLGMQEIAVSMSNPFGDDPTDFDTRTLCQVNSGGGG